MKNIITILLLTVMSGHIYSQNIKKSELVFVNGKKLYYEVYGEGTPLFLLHGYSLSSQSWKPYVEKFEKDYKVYLVDLTGHGKSDPFKDDLSIKSVGEDINALVSYLNLEKVKAIGFSFGGDVLFQLALINPSLIESMITIGAVGTWTVNDFPQYQQVFTFENRADFPWLESSHQSDEQVKGIMNQFKNYTISLSDIELQQIQAEVMIMMGDDDEGMNFDEVARVKKNLRNSDVWILPDVSHSAHEGEHMYEFILKAKTFLSKTR
ncbi:alpha/beta hydrolase [Ekhidna sp.]|uniref:alpha/beta fold hydrolase n=1 Tax=Ekhidna sp. TaxID=2608089 RepID=UPI003299F88B